MDTMSYLLGKKNAGGSGTTNYSDLSNKPQINDTELSGNKSSSDLGLQDELISGTNIKTINNTSILGEGNIQISGGSGAKIFVIENTTHDIKIDTVETGVYVFKSSVPRLRIEGLNGNKEELRICDVFYFCKKYEDASVDEVIGHGLNYYGSYFTIYKKNNAKGYDCYTNPGGLLNMFSNYYYLTFTNFSNIKGIDSTKTQVLKNVNGTLTWVDE